MTVNIDPKLFFNSTHIDSYLAKNGSFTRALKWTRSWLPLPSSPLKSLENFVTVHLSSLFNEGTLDKVALNCGEKQNFGKEPLEAFTKKASLHSCALKLISNKQEVFSEKIASLIKKSPSDKQAAALSYVLEKLTGSNATEAISFDSLRNAESMGSQFNALYEAIPYTPSLTQQFFNKFHTTPLNSSSSTANDTTSYFSKVTCRILSDQPYLETCISKLGSELFSIRTEAHTNGKTIFNASPKMIDSIKSNLTTNSMAPFPKVTIQNPDNAGYQALTYYPSLSSYLPSMPSFKAPSNQDLINTLLIPAGLGITYAGIQFAKESYQDEKRPQLRKTVGVITGVVTACLGLFIASRPFSA